MTKPHGWKNSFSLFDEVTIACSGETGHVVGEFIDNSYLVRYRRADGVATEEVWSADALTQTPKAPVALRVVQ